MRPGSWIVRGVTLLLMAAMPAAVGAIEPCFKNHFILDEPCALPATTSAIGRPGAVAVDTQGNVYFSSPNIVFKLSEGGLTRVAGNGKSGFAGDGGPAFDALLSFPASYPEMEMWPSEYSPLAAPLALDTSGNLYIGDVYNNRVRRVDARGIIQTVAGSGKRSAWGSFHLPDLWWPQGVAIDSAGLLLVADATGVLRRIQPDGTQVALTDNNCGAHINAGLCAPLGIAIDARGDIFAADGYCRVRKVTTAGTVMTVAGADRRPDRGSIFTCGFSGDGGPATHAALAGPRAVAVDNLGGLYIADPYNHCVRKVDPAGVIRTAAGTCGFEGFGGDGGAAIEARLNQPHGVALDAAGNLFIADSGNYRIRRIKPDGMIETIAGNGAPLPE